MRKKWEGTLFLIHEMTGVWRNWSFLPHEPPATDQRLLQRAAIDPSLQHVRIGLRHAAGTQRHFPAARLDRIRVCLEPNQTAAGATRFDIGLRRTIGCICSLINNPRVNRVAGLPHGKSARSAGSAMTPSAAIAQNDFVASVRPGRCRAATQNRTVDAVAGRCVATVCRTSICIIAAFRHASLAKAATAKVTGRAQVAVTASRRIVGVSAAGGLVTTVVGARIAIVTSDCDTRTISRRADIAAGAGAGVIATRCIIGKNAAVVATRVGRARVLVVANQALARAKPAGADVGTGATVAVVATRSVADVGATALG